MRKRTTVFIALLFSWLPGQALTDNIHYPFNHNWDHNEQSNCRSYAMAYVLPGSHCPVGMVGDIVSLDTRLFTPKVWDIDSINIGNLVLWGEFGSDHVAVVTNIYGRDSSYDIEVTHKISASGAIVPSERLIFVRPYPPTHYAVKSPSWDLIVENRFSNGITGGKIGIKHGLGSMVEQDSPYSDRFTWGSFHTLNAFLDQKNYGGGYWSLDQWIDASEFNERNASTQISYQVQLIYGNTNHYIAAYKKKYNVIVENDFIGINYKGFLTVDDTLRQLPFSKSILEGEIIKIAAPLNSQTYDHIDYEFTQWSTGDENHTITITPESNMTITAHYRGYPRSMAHYGLTSGTIIGDNIKLTWNVHPNQNVSRYDIYRKIKPKLGPWGGRIKITSVNRNATSWIDPQYILTNGYSDDLLLYDVSPFYSTESTNGKIDWTVSFGEDFDSDDFFMKRENEQYSTPNEFNLKQNHPNPFNPTTTIKYELPEASSVSISIYDIRGNEVKTWESGNESPGFKQITWQATDSHGNKVPAGIYICKLTATSHETNKVFSKSMKMVLLK